MQEDTESCNENSNSEVIILSQNNHLEGTSVSDEEDTDTETSLSYDAKLNAKLKDLGLYEDGMTIQQKEELLAVVAVSFKTAEEEKTRRRWYEDYVNAALAFPDDEIEFSFQQSTELDVPNQNSNEYQNIQSVSQNYKVKPFSQGRHSKETGISHKLALEEGNTVTYHSDVSILNSKDILPQNNKQKKLYLEKCMSRWKPCLSPKEEPLICPRRQMPEETDEPKPISEPEYKKRMQDISKTFNFALTQIKHTRKSPSALGRPYHITRSGHCIKKFSKLDSYDLLIGVPEDQHESTSDPGTSDIPSPDQKEPFSRTSVGAFHYAQLQREKIDALKSNSAIVNSHSFSPQSCSKPFQEMSEEEEKVFPEIVLEDELDERDIIFPEELTLTVNGDLSLIDCTDRFAGKESANRTKLPKFSNLRPNLSIEERLTDKGILRYNVPSAYSTLNCIESNATSNCKKENHIDSLSPEENLSDSSSVIDVETIVDDEIEEFVLKRKLLQEPVNADKQSYSNRFKRLKKNA